MAGKQSSEVKRRTASTRKTTTTRKSSAGKKRNTSGKSAHTKVSRMQVSEYTEPVGDEIKLIIILAVSILILLSVFGLGIQGRKPICRDSCNTFSVKSLYEMERKQSKSKRKNRKKEK